MKLPIRTLNTLSWTALVFLASCASTLPPLPEVDNPPLSTKRLVQLYPLPGGVNTKKVFYSNRPELIQTPGEIFSSTSLPQKNNADLLKGDFSVFAHHVVEAKPFDFTGFRLGLLARPAQGKTTGLTLRQAFVARTRPESPFISLSSVLTQIHESPVSSGPGDAMAWARLQQKSSYPEEAFLFKSLPLSLSIRQETLIADIGIPTFPLGFMAQRNALSAWLDMTSTEAIDLRWVALKTLKASASLSDYQQAAQLTAGPSEEPATVYDPQEPPPRGVFRFGRVAGVVQGSQWTGEHSLSDQEMKAIQEGQLLAWPVATTYLKAWGKQNQSAPLLARQAESAVESHGNYGMEYQLRYHVSNTSDKPLSLQWRWTQPTTVAEEEDIQNMLSYAPKTQIVFRGSVKVQNSCKPEDTAYHLQTQQGHWHQPFYEHLVPPHKDCQLVFQWVYPPDAIPPHILSVEKKP